MIKIKSRDEYLDELFKLIDVDSIGAEIGVLYGEFAMKLYQKLTPLELYLIDPFDTNHIRYDDGGLTTAYSTSEDLLNVVERFKNLHTVYIYRHYSYDAVEHFTDNIFDFIYHDASHLYKDVKQDLKDYLPKLKPDGLMCGHDYGGGFPGVRQAVDEFCETYNFEMIILNENGGDFALRRKV